MHRLLAKTNILSKKKKSQRLDKVTGVFYHSGLVTLHHEVLRSKHSNEKGNHPFISQY